MEEALYVFMKKLPKKKRVGKRQFQLQLMVIPAMVFFFIFIGYLIYTILASNRISKETTF